MCKGCIAAFKQCLPTEGTGLDWWKHVEMTQWPGWFGFWGWNVALFVFEFSVWEEDIPWTAAVAFFDVKASFKFFNTLCTFFSFCHSNLAVDCSKISYAVFLNCMQNAMVGKIVSVAVSVMYLCLVLLVLWMENKPLDSTVKKHVIFMPNLPACLHWLMMGALLIVLRAVMQKESEDEKV